MTRQTYALAALAALTLALTGCPLLGGENNDANDDADLPDATPGGDTGSDAGPDTGADADAGDDGPGECEAEYALTGSVAAADGAFSQTWVVVCDAPMAADEFGDEVTLARADGSAEQAVSLGGVSCAPGDDRGLEGLFVCELTLEGITEAAPADGGPLGAVEYVAHASDPAPGMRTRERAVRRLRNRYRVSSTRVASAQLPRDLIGLPAGFATRGVGARALQVESGRVVFGVTRSEDGGALEVFSVAPDGQITTHKEAALPAGGFASSGFEVAETPAGANALWWGFDATGGTLRGISVALGADGSAQSVDELDPTSYTGQPLTRVLDASYGITEVAGAPRLTARLLAVTDRDTFAVVRVGAAGASLERELDSLVGSVPSALSPGRVGLLSGEDVEALDLDADAGSAWIADQNGKLSSVSLDASSEPVSVSFTSVQFPYELSVSPRTRGGHVATVTSEGAPARAFALGVKQGGGLDGTVTELAAPTGGIDPNGAWIIEDAVVIQLGRWPWNWRDKFKKNGFADVPVVTQWDLSKGGPDEAAPVASVKPVVAEDPAAAVGAGDGDRVFASITPDGMLELQKLDALTPGCADQKACALPITDFTRRGYRLDVMPGEAGVTWAVDRYGDILIDGVPLVFDLTAPPVIFDAPGAQDQGAIVVASIAHESATHAVWTTDTRGALSAPGLLNVTGGEPGESIVFAEGDDGDDGDCDEGIVGLELTLGTVLIDFTKDDGDSEDRGRAAPVTVRADELTAAIGAAEPLALDLSDRLPGPDGRVDDVITLDPACSVPAESSLRDAPEGAERVATITPEQAARPIVATVDGDTLTLYGRAADGALAQIATTTGVGGGVAHARSAVAWPRDYDPRIKRRRLRIKKKNVGTPCCRSFGSSRDGRSGEADEVDVYLESVEDQDGQLVLGMGDFDGDGLDDVVVSPAGGPARILLGDGAGGLLPQGVDVPGGPTVTWPAFVRATAAGARGTGRGRGITGDANDVIWVGSSRAQKL